MDYQTLKRIKNKSVQQQNQLTYLEIKKIAESFRNDPQSSPCLLTALADHNLDITQGLVVDCDVGIGQDCHDWDVLWLTFDQRFFCIEMVTDFKSDE